VHKLSPAEHPGLMQPGSSVLGNGYSRAQSLRGPLSSAQVLRTRRQAPIFVVPPPVSAVALPTLAGVQGPCTMPLPIVAGPMKRQWHICRQVQAMEDGARRWDHAYHLLLQWRKRPEAPLRTAPPPRRHPPVEDRYENGHLCPRLAPTSEPRAADCTPGNAPAGGLGGPRRRAAARTDLSRCGL
jgi:hypothetical protein